ncbi:hypothetical protein JXA47_11515 [Candidatus Sumerlaeota bacterium]|nr:hypothetical protein [Candidatus Sumerlaeota bacterium]
MDASPEGLRIDSEQCAALGRAVLAHPIRPDAHFQMLPQNLTPDQETLLWLVSTAICQQTRTLEGTIAGHWLRGSDYLIAALGQHMARNPGLWTPEALRGWESRELCAATSDEGDAETSTLDRVEERLDLLRGVAAHLVDRWAGRAMAIHETSDARVATLLDRLAAIPAYTDPVRKKSHLLLMVLHERGLWPLADPENLETAIDYHIMRVALRFGIVEVVDPALRRTLVDQIPVSEAVDTAVRFAVRQACREVVRLSPGLTPFRLDNALWMIGRSCCFYDHPPVCTSPAQCQRSDICSLINILNAPCDLSCPLSSECRGAVDRSLRRLHETAFDSHFY